MTFGPVAPTNRARSIEYAIRDVLSAAHEVEKSGKKVIYLNIGDPARFDFKTPTHIRRALTKAVEKGANYYGASEGILPLREAVAEKESTVNAVPIKADDVLITLGISEGIQLIMGALINPGDEVLVPGPTYPPYISFVKFFGGIPISYGTIEQNDWLPDLQDLKKRISEKTRALIVVNPNNPTGSLYDRKTLVQMLDIAAENDLPVISDEIYDRLTYDSQFVSTASLTSDVPVVGLNGFSKTYAMTGWRLGYMYFHDPANALDELREGIAKETRIRLSAVTPIQHAAIRALKGPQGSVYKMVRALKKRRDHFLRRIRAIKGLSCTTPKGAFYLFPKVDLGERWKSDREFSIDLLKTTGVLVVSGSGFDPVYGAGHFRTVFLPPTDLIDDAADRIEKFMQ